MYGRSVGAMDSVSDFESGGCGFESRTEYSLFFTLCYLLLVSIYFSTCAPSSFYFLSFSSSPLTLQPIHLLNHIATDFSHFLCPTKNLTPSSYSRTSCTLSFSSFLSIHFSPIEWMTRPVPPHVRCTKVLFAFYHRMGDEGQPLIFVTLVAEDVNRPYFF